MPGIIQRLRKRAWDAQPEELPVSEGIATAIIPRFIEDGVRKAAVRELAAMLTESHEHPYRREEESKRLQDLAWQPATPMGTRIALALHGDTRVRWAVVQSAATNADELVETILPKRVLEYVAENDQDDEVKDIAKRAAKAYRSMVDLRMATAIERERRALLRASGRSP